MKKLIITIITAIIVTAALDSRGDIITDATASVPPEHWKMGFEKSEPAPAGKFSLEVIDPGAITNALSFFKEVLFDAGLAAHWDKLTVLVPSTGQTYVFATLHRGSWRWRFGVLHCDSFFDDGVEDSFGGGVSLTHGKTPIPSAITRPAKGIIDLSEYDVNLGVANETGHLFVGKFESDALLIRIAAAFKM